MSQRSDCPCCGAFGVANEYRRVPCPDCGSMLNPTRVVSHDETAAMDALLAAAETDTDTTRDTGDSQ